MDLGAVMAEVAGRLDGLGGLRAFAFPPKNAPAPFAVCGAPEAPGLPLTYSRSGLRGADRITLPVAVAVGQASDRASWAALMAYTSTEGASSVIAALEIPDVYTAFDTLQVLGFEVGELTMGDVVYLAVTFNVDIVG